MSFEGRSQSVDRRLTFHKHHAERIRGIALGDKLSVGRPCWRRSRLLPDLEDEICRRNEVKATLFWRR